MIDRKGCQGGRVRSLFVSDVHLGCRHGRTKLFLDFLHAYQPETLYLVGDFVDGWKLRRRWLWRPEYTQVLRRLLDLSRAGTRLCYAPGNHDDFLRDFLENLGFMEVAQHFIHETETGQRLLVVHGDRFDRIEVEARWLSQLSTVFYDALLLTNYWLNRWQQKPHHRYRFCASLKGSVKSLVNHFSDFEAKLVEAAHRSDCDGVVCGHIHMPRITTDGPIIYCNTGDWVENCTALVEHHDGSLEIVYYDGTPGERWEPDRQRYSKSLSDAAPDLLPSPALATVG